MAWYLIEERRRWSVITAPHEDNVLNKFRILKERHVQVRKPYQSPGRMKNTFYYIAPVGNGTHDLPHIVASHMVKVCHAHSATEAVRSPTMNPFLTNSKQIRRSTRATNTTETRSTLVPLGGCWRRLPEPSRIGDYLVQRLGLLSYNIDTRCS